MRWNDLDNDEGREKVRGKGGEAPYVAVMEEKRESRQPGQAF